jgi:glycosyltransferase involved in cell wall biosynthesis
MRSAKKIVYISNPFYLDYDLPLIKNLAKEIDIYYFLDISPISAQATLLKIDNFDYRPHIDSGDKYNVSNLFEGYLPKGKTFLINRRTNKPSISNLKLQFVLAKLITKISPDILHFNTDFNHNYLLIPFLCKISFVYTVHDPLPHSDDDLFKERLKRKIFFPFVKNFIVLNHEQRNDFIQRYRLKNINVFVSSLSIYEYLSLRITRIPHQYQHSSGYSMRIIFFGRINQYKGINYLLKAFAKIVTRYPKTELVIAGKGDIRPYDTGFSKNVTFINKFIPNDELALLINESDFVVCPYIDATQSGVIMTAFAFAKPVITTDVGGLKEFVEDGITGFLIKPKDEDLLAVTMEKFITNPDLLNHMSKNIQDIYHSGDRSWGNIARNTVNIYNKLL